MPIILSDEVISRFPSGLGSAEAIGLFVIANDLNAKNQRVDIKTLCILAGLNQKKLIESMNVLITSGLAVKESNSVRFLFDRFESKTKSRLDKKKKLTKKTPFNVKVAIKTVEALVHIDEKTLANLLDVSEEDIKKWTHPSILRRDNILRHRGKRCLTDQESIITRLIASKGVINLTDLIVDSGIATNTIKKILSRSPWIVRCTRGVYRLITNKPTLSEIEFVNTRPKVVLDSGVNDSGPWIDLVVSKSLVWKKTISVPKRISNFLPNDIYKGNDISFINVRNNEIQGISYPGMAFGDTFRLIFDVKTKSVKMESI